MKITITFLALLLAGCATVAPSIPKGYTGNTARIDDSFKRLSHTKVNIYYISSLNDKPIYNSFAATSTASDGRGAQIVTVIETRLVPAQPQTFRLVGLTYNAPSLGAVFNPPSDYVVAGDVTFTPKPDGHYFVSGKLGKDYSAVWIEDINGEIVSDLIELKSENYTPPKVTETEYKTAPTSRSEYFFSLAGGESVIQVKNKLGEPDSILRKKGNHLIQKPPTVFYTYKDLGEIQFSSRKNAAELVLRVIPLVSESIDMPTFKTQLNSEGFALQTVAKNYYGLENIEQEKLDLIAEKIWLNKNSEDRATVDGLAWLCKVISKSGNPRYRTLLENVSTSAQSGKLRKHALKSLELLPNEEATQWTHNEV